MYIALSTSGFNNTNRENIQLEDGKGVNNASSTATLNLHVTIPQIRGLCMRMESSQPNVASKRVATLVRRGFER